MNAKLRLLPVVLCALAASFFGGCKGKSSPDGFIKRADAYYEQKDMERARIEYLNAYRAQPANAHVLTRLAQISQERGEFGPAFQLFSRIKEVDPTNLVARAGLGSIYAIAGERDKAREEAEFLLAQQPGHGEALLILAATAAGTNEVRATLERFEKIEAAQPTNAFAHLGLGNLRLRSRDVKGAESSFKKASELEPNSSKFQIALAGVYWVQGQTNEADAAFQRAASLESAKSGARLRWADFKLKTGQVEQAKKILEESIQQSPDFAPALNSLAEIAIVQKRTNDAAAFVAKVIESEPNNYNALRTRAKLKAAARDFPGAIEELEIVAKQYPKDHTTPYQIALVQIAEGDSVKALGSLDRALNINPAYFEASYLKAELLLSKGQHNDAVLMLNELADRNPQRPQPRYLLANAYRSRGATNEALATYQKIRDLNPKDAQAPHMMGLLYRAMGQTNEARQAFESALAIIPNFVAPLDELIELDILSGNSAAALARIGGYLQQYPDKPVPHYLLAKILSTQKKTAEAEAALLKSIEVGPDYAPSHNALAQLYVASGRFDKALEKYAQIAEKNPKDALAKFQIGAIYERQNDLPKAIAAYERVVAEHPKYVPALNNLAYLLSEKRNEPERAYEMAKIASEAAPNDPSISDTFGWILFKRGEYERALPWIQKAAQRLPNQPEVQQHLGMLHYMFGNEVSARAVLAKIAESAQAPEVKTDADAALQVLNTDPSKADAAAVQMLSARAAANPKDLMAHLRLAQISALQSKPAESRQSFEAAYKLNPKALPVLIQYAAFAVDRLGDKKRALELVKEARAISQDKAFGFEIGRVATLAGDYSWALPILEEVQSAQPENPRAQLYTGLANFGVGKQTAAALLLQQAAGSAQNFPEKQIAGPLLSLVQFTADPASAPQAAAASAAFLKSQPDFPPALLVSGLVLEKENQYPKAREAYEKALAVASDFLPAQRQLALLLGEKLADDNRAYEIGSKIRPLLSEDAALSKTLGKIAYRRGDHRDAIRLLKDSASRVPADADLLYHLGLAQHQVGDRQAKKSLGDAVIMDAGNKLADAARKALSELN